MAPRLAFADTPSPPAPEELDASLDRQLRLTTPVWIDGQGPFEFVVDTGSNNSLIAEDLAASLGLPAAGLVVVNTISGAETMPTVRARSVGVGKPGGKGAMLAISGRDAIGGAGLLGIDQLDNLRLTLNFKQKRLAVGASGHRLADGSAIRIPARQRSGQLTLLDAEVDDLPVTAFVDSGSEATIGNMALRRALGDRVRPLSEAESLAEVPVIGATGLATAGEIGIVPSLRFGGLRVRRCGVVFADLHTFRVWGMADQPALVIGVDFLRRFETVDLDFGRSLVLFRVPGGRSSKTGTRTSSQTGGSGVSIRSGG